MSEYRKCNKCNEIGVIYNSETDSAKLCDCQIKRKQNQSFNIALENSGFPQKQLPQSFSSFDSRIRYKGTQSKDNISNLNKYITNFENAFK